MGAKIARSSRRSASTRAGTYSTIAFIAGGTLVAGGVALYFFFTAPSGSTRF